MTPPVLQFAAAEMVAVPLAVWNDVQARLAALEGKAVAPPASRPLSMTPEAIRQRRRQAKKRETKVRGVISRDHDHGTPSHDLNARAAVDLDQEREKQRSTSGSKIARSKPERRTRAESDHRRELARLYRGFSGVVDAYAGGEYPQPAPWTEQRAARLLLAERGVNPTLKAAVEFCRKWQPTREHAYPTLALLRFKLLEDEHARKASSSAPRRAPVAPSTREGPQPRIWHGDLDRTRAQDVPRAVGAILEQLGRRGPP